MNPEASSRKADNKLVLRKLLVIAVVMFGFGFALVPFYKEICEVTGINNLMQADAAPINTQIDRSRLVTIEFDTNIHGLPWQFRPLEKSVQVHPGEMAQVMFEIVNESDMKVTGQAIPSYGPQFAGNFFKKIECFCFSQQALNAREAKQIPVQFVIDPALPADVTTITLSYLFFEVNGADRRNPG